MSERIITFTLTGQNISSDYTAPEAVNESKGYLRARFILDETWSACKRYEAIFYNEHVLAEPVELGEDMTCDIPAVVLEKPVTEVYCGIVGYGENEYRLTSDYSAIELDQAAYTTGRTPKRPSEDLYAKIMAAIEGKVDKRWGESNKGKYLVIGEDGNVTIGSGGGGSGESGKDGVTFIPSVSSDGVISWTNDGGKQNPDPVNIKGPQGPQGPQGDDYTLTEADKQEIAEMAAELVPSGGGSGGLLDGCELIASGVLSEAVGIDIKKDSNGNDFLLSKVVFLLFGEFDQPGGFLAVRIVDESNEWYGTEISPGSSAKGLVMTTEKNGVMSIKVLRADGVGRYWGYGVAEELFHTRLVNTDGTIYAEIQKENAKNVYVGNWASGTKPAAGTIYALYGVRA